MELDIAPPRLDVLSIHGKTLIYAVSHATMLCGEYQKGDIDTLTNLADTIRSAMKLALWQFEFEENFIWTALENDFEQINPAHSDVHKDLVNTARSILLRLEVNMGRLTKEEQSDCFKHIYDSLAKFHRGLLYHLFTEIEAVNDLLWSLYSDATLQGIGALAFAPLEAPGSLDRLKWMALALNPSELALTLKHFKALSQPHTYSSSLSWIAGIINVEKWYQLSIELKALSCYE